MVFKKAKIVILKPIKYIGANGKIVLTAKKIKTVEDEIKTYLKDYSRHFVIIDLADFYKAHKGAVKILYNIMYFLNKDNHRVRIINFPVEIKESIVELCSMLFRIYFVTIEKAFDDAIEWKSRYGS